MSNAKRTLENLELVGGALCLDFVNTVNSRYEPEHDYIASYADLVDWAAKMELFSPAQAKTLKQKATQESSKAENILETKDWAIVEWRFSGTMKGDFAGHPPNHNVFDMNGCEMFQIANGKIIIQHGYWDKATMFTQLKIPL